MQRKICNGYINSLTWDNGLIICAQEQINDHLIIFLSRVKLAITILALFWNFVFQIFLKPKQLYKMLPL
jgi:hypothetical protein